MQKIIVDRFKESGKWYTAETQKDEDAKALISCPMLIHL